MPHADVDGASIYYEVRGQGVPLVLITGLGGGHLAWFFQLRPFSRHFRVVTFDSRGIGRSDRPCGPYSIARMARDVVGLMDWIGVPKAHVLGVSLGGMVAQELAIDHPQRVMKLVLASTSAGSEEGDGRMPRWMAKVGMATGNAGVQPRVDSLMKAMNSVSYNTRPFRWLVAPLARVYARKVAGEAAASQFQAAASHSTVDRLHLISAPTLVIAGTDDRLIPASAAGVLAARIANARLVLIEGGSHTLVAEMRGRFNREVLAFLGGAEEGS